MDALPVALGLDFGTESVRAVLIDRAGGELGARVCPFRHGQITQTLPGSEVRLPAEYALQCPGDWLESAGEASRKAITASGIDPSRVVGVGVDFTSCTMLPCRRDATPLCEWDEFADVPLAWPKLWKHHAAVRQTDLMNAVARRRGESFLDRYGGTIGLEWFFPKMLETIQCEPAVADAAEVWLEAGDWVVWRLVGGPAETLPRSTCQAGYKALWSPESGYASGEYFEAVDPRLAEAVRHKMPGRMLSPGQNAGTLCDAMAERLGLRSPGDRSPATSGANLSATSGANFSATSGASGGIAVSAATIDAHAGVPGVGQAGPGTLVMVMGTSSCHMLNATEFKPVPGVAGVVRGGILPGLYGYETGQAAVGDAFAWLLTLLGRESFDDLAEAAMRLPAGADGVLCLDWMNGCRTPLMDGGLSGAFTGLTLATTPAHLYRAMMEGSAMGVRWIVDVMTGAASDASGLPVDRLVATGGLPHHNPSLVQIYADVLQMDIEIHPSKHGPAVGAAVLGMFAAGPRRSGFETIAEAATAMAAVRADAKQIVHPDRQNAAAYDDLYDRYRSLATFAAG